MSVVVRFRQVIRTFCLKLRYLVLTRVYHMDISPSSRISLGAVLDKTNPKGIHVGNGSYIASGARVFTHDFSRGLHKDTYIGQNVFIGADSIIMCGVSIGDEVVVGAGSVVTKDVPSHSIVAGNPARIIREGIHTTQYGRLLPKP